MQLRRIEIRDFRKLGHAVIDDLGDGLSVIVGDNEAGKSTVLSALRAVLFERHRVSGDVVKRMLPYGQNVRPEVSVEFDLKGARWRLRKAFHQRQEAELVGPGERIAGDAVEDRLAQLFSFTPPGKGQSKQEEHQGLYGLLWVEQGRSHQSLGVGGGRDTLASALEGEVGQVIGGERGRSLLSAAAERKNLFWGKNEKPRGDFRALADKLDALNDRRAALQDSLRQHDDKVAALALREAALARHKRDERLLRAIEAVRATKDAVTRAVGLERTLDEAMLRLAGCDKDRTIAAEHLQRRTELCGQVERAACEVAGTAASAGEARGLLVRRQEVAEAAEKHCAEGRAACRAADDRLRLLEGVLAWRRETEALKKAEAQLAQAERYAAGQREAVASAAAVTIGPKDVTDLERLQKALDQAQAELRVASVQIAFEPLGQQTIAVDGVPQGIHQPLHLSRDAVLDLEGFGRLLVRPGGGVDSLARASDEAARKLDDRLRGLGFSAVPEAKAMLARKIESEQEAAAMGKLLSAVATNGLDALRQAVESERAALARPLPDAAAKIVAADEGAMENARRAKDEAMLAERSADAQANESRESREHAARELAILEERAAGARAQHESRVAELAAARARTSDEVLRERLADAAKACRTAEAEVAAARAALYATDPALARLDLERAEAAERTIRADIDKLTSERRDLQVELGVLGRAGLGEELSEVEGQIERLSREKVAKDLEASASRLLLDTLTEAQRESKDRWLGPVRERVKPYLRFLEPDSEIVLNEQTLEIEGITRRGVSEPFQALSMGAREQVAVITRLALADVLRASGQPSALILDDALVNSDEGRLERMHRVLQTAARSLQVLVLTCRERDFVGLGDIKRL